MKEAKEVASMDASDGSRKSVARVSVDQDSAPHLKSLFHMKRISLGIKSQLIIIVAFSAVFSLLALAITTGVYFNNTLTRMQATKLQVMAQLKVTQVEQSMQLLYNQVYWVSIRPPIEEALTAIRVGNYSEHVFQEARETLDTSISSTELLNSARLYDLNLNVVAASVNNLTYLDGDVAENLYFLEREKTIPRSLYSTSINPYYQAPLSNVTYSGQQKDMNVTYFMGFTFPVFSNASAVYDTPTLSGFLTMIVNVTSVQKAVEDTSDMTNNSASFYMISPTWTEKGSSDKSPYKTESQTTLSAWNYVFGFRRSDKYLASDKQDSWLRTVLTHPPNITATHDRDQSCVSDQSCGHFVHVAGRYGENAQKPVAVGYAHVLGMNNLNWHVIVEQSWKTFSEPVNRLKGIIAVVVLCTCIVVCSITFGLAVLFVKPITKLQEATECIAKFKNSPEYMESRESAGALAILELPNTGSFDRSNRESRQALEVDGGASRTSNMRKRNRMSLLSTASRGSGAAASGLRLPGKIPMVSSFFKDELTELTDAFNIMTEELETQYQYLEERVKMRTRELEASKIEAESANEAKTVFIANISHELRTPLNGILGMTAVAMDEDDNTRTHDSLKLIYRSGELLLHILTELLTYSKNTLNRSKLEPTNFQILEVVYQVKSIFEKLALDQRVSFSIILEPNVLRKLILYGDSNRIIQIIMNLVSNALKFTPIEGSVKVNFKLLGEYDEAASGESNHTQVCIKPDQELPTMDGNRPSASPNGGVRSRPSTLALGHSVFESTALATTGAASATGSGTGDVMNNRRISLESRVPRTPERENSPRSMRTGENSGIDLTSSKFSNLDSPPSNRKQSIDISLLQKPQSLVSSLTTGRILGENKKYKLRKIYVPKTWVIRIEVSDTGPGIEPALQDKVFEPFIQGDQTLSRSYGGTGLGLSICRQLAAMMKGTLSLKSELGIGSTFIFTVPLRQTGEIIVNEGDLHEFCEDEFNPASRMNRKVAFKSTPLASPMILTEDLDDDSASTDTEGYFAMCKTSSKYTSNGGRMPSTSQSPDPSRTLLRSTIASKPLLQGKLSQRSLDKAKEGNVLNARGLDSLMADSNDSCESDFLKILVAEDNKVNQEVIRRMLRLEGWENVMFAFNGEEAIEMYEDSVRNKQEYSIILMDVQMPKLDGLAATRIIRLQNEDIPIIALTAFADESNVKECLNSGMSGFLSKPIKRKDLRNIVSLVCPAVAAVN